jgi:hypothetical protein
MAYQQDNQSGGKPKTTENISNNQPTNQNIYQPAHQHMRNDYMHISNESEYHDSQRHQGQMNQEEVHSYQRKQGYPGQQGKNGTFYPYFRQDDMRYPQQPNHNQVERRTDAQPAEDTRKMSENVQYAFPSRDGPSPGRNYNYAPPQDERAPQERRMVDPTKPPSHPFRTPLPSSSRAKRKAMHGDPSTPDAARLISHQSSDDSINALLPKKVKLGSLFPSESASFLKSFTLSPMNSRTFSREEPIDMPRFAASRGSSDGSRIFHSWSSGNSRSENHSPSDVRNCYVDWHSASTVVRRGSFENGNNRPAENKPRSDQPTNPPSQIQTRYDHRTRADQPQSWQGSAHPADHPSSRGQSNNLYDAPKMDRGYHPSSRQLQPLHPEDRYNEQLLQGYSAGIDTNRPYWNNQGPPVPHLYQSQRRDDIEDRSNNQMVRGHPPHPHPSAHTRLSAPTPPVTNGWGRYGNDYHPPMYDTHGRNIHPSSYDSWGQPGNRGGPYDGPYNPVLPMKECGPPSYSDSLGHLKSITVESGANGSTGMRTADGILLLSLPEDRISLSETLCIVRENVEVFIATEADVKAPAPGRKRPVVEGQVGLRCIHCRAAVHQSEKVKRAVCFPSSIKRIYRTVIDMKLDHFKACRFVPIELKLKLEELRATNARSTGTTMQYFVQAAKRMGMIDGGHGIRFEKPVTVGTKDDTKGRIVKSEDETQRPPNTSSIIRQPSAKSGSQQSVQPGVSFTLSLDLSISGDSNNKSKEYNSGKDDSSDDSKKKASSPKFYVGKTMLSVPEDKSALSPLRCFLRENVCAFSATSEDIAVRTPTTFSVVLGQVGIGCIHCLSLPARERSNRAVCFPFSIGRIYQSVADIQRFHFGECKMVPPHVRAKFLELQSASSKGSKGLATRQYWVSSAKRLGLVDSDCGIRFARDPSIPIEKAKSLDILAQVASDVTTAAQPLVLPEDKPLIAGFLYVVMKQLQPCRFTEADRNKRRLKDVGCIGVECRHCAGQVDGRKFFWSSVNAVESNFVSVHTHMMECKNIPNELKDKLAHLKTLRKEQTTRLKSGSQKAFFSRVWKRLHSEGTKVPTGGTPANPKQKPVQQVTPSPQKLVFATSSPPLTDVNPSMPSSSPLSPLICSPTQESTLKVEQIDTPDSTHTGVNNSPPPAATFPSPIFTCKLESPDRAAVPPMTTHFPPSAVMAPFESAQSQRMTNNTNPPNTQSHSKKDSDLNVSVVEEI